MLSGDLPFKGEYEQAIAYSIINEEPEPLILNENFSYDIKTLVNKLLSKEPEKRYQEMKDVVNDLKNIY